MSKSSGQNLVITRVCSRCGRKIVSRNGDGRRTVKCPSCSADIREPLITLVGTTAARRKRGHSAMLQLLGACKTGKKNISARHDDYLYEK